MSSELEQIEKQLRELQAKRDQLREREKADAIAEVRKMVALYGITAQELGFYAAPAASGERKQRAPAAVKYRSGDNTWTGRGRKPRWVSEYEAAGGTLDEIAV